MRKRIDSHKCSDVKPWVIAAIEDEERCRSDQMWKDEPTAESIGEERLRQIKFLRKHGNTHPDALVVAKRLESCEPKHRCLSAACPECERLFQRWFVRRSRKFIARHIALPGNWLVAVSIVPSGRIIPPGQLSVLDIAKLQRRLKYALKQTKITVALGGIDFSLNEDREGKYQPFWCPHFYLITSTENKKKLGDKLRQIYVKSEEVPRPVKISSFKNIARRRSYALKMIFYRRVGYHQIKNNNGKSRKCRNTSRQKLRAAERLELFIYLDKIGLASRVIFRRAKPVVKSSPVKIVKCGH
jgi:hypothetical protein